MGKRWETDSSCLSKPAFPEMFRMCSESVRYRRKASFLTGSIWKIVSYHFYRSAPHLPQVVASHCLAWCKTQLCHQQSLEMRCPTFLISAFPQGKFGRLLGSKCANKPADSHFPLLVIMHFNEVDGLMLRLANRPLRDRPLSLLCFISAELIASVMVTHRVGSVCSPHPFSIRTSLWKTRKPGGKHADPATGRSRRLSAAVAHYK